MGTLKPFRTCSIVKGARCMMTDIHSPSKCVGRAVVRKHACARHNVQMSSYGPKTYRLMSGVGMKCDHIRYHRSRLSRSFMAHSPKYKLKKPAVASSSSSGQPLTIDDQSSFS